MSLFLDFRREEIKGIAYFGDCHISRKNSAPGGIFNVDKRFEPAITASLCYSLSGNSKGQYAVGTGNPLTDDPAPAAVAVELLHTESIIHDDIIDEDDVRRDKESFNKRYGLGPSILSADFVLGMILQIASQYSDSRIGRELSKSVLRMSEGEFAELKVLTEKRQIKTDEYIEIIANKTASLFQSSARIGAIIAGAKQQTIESMSDFGLNLGIAYQMQDDLLDWNMKPSLQQALGAEQQTLQKMSYEFALASKNALAHLAYSESKERLEELAEFAVRRRF